MPVTYYDLGHARPLHQIVFAGTHDAGITSGAENAQTQDLNIYEQAAAGARIFDLRVAAHVVQTKNGNKIIQMQTFHADPKLVRDKKGSAINLRTGETSRLTKSSLLSGEWGMSLSKVLIQARNFVNDNPTEFLLLKFDKCKNYDLIARACGEILGRTLYTGAGGNINTKTLFELSGSVIPMVPMKGYNGLTHALKQNVTIWRNLSKSDEDPSASYNPNFPGLQYYGGGGTSPMNGRSTSYKITENEKKQRKKMLKMAAAGADVPEVLGMMYWTTTGLKASIRDRDDAQWSGPNRARLAQLWKEGLGESIEARLPSALDPTSYSAAGNLKTFMPNFVMVDFMSEEKGRYIKSLNEIAALELTQQAIQGQALEARRDQIIA